jgi:hypothetical protein
MFKGTVTFCARIKGNGLTFPLCEFNHGEPGVDKVALIGWNGDEILSTVYLASVETREAGKSLATKVNTAALNRISFLHSIAIENDKIAGSQFSPLDPPFEVQVDAQVHPDTGDYVYVGEAVRLVLGISAESIKVEIEKPSLPGERYYGLLRSARQSLSPVEEFVHVYNILLMLYDDSFMDVDDFILSKDPAVPQTPDPRNANRKETVYTRLRHELAHARAGVNMDSTKAEMTKRVSELIALTKQAIESQP